MLGPLQCLPTHLQPSDIVEHLFGKLVLAVELTSYKQCQTVLVHATSQVMHKQQLRLMTYKLYVA